LKRLCTTNAFIIGMYQHVSFGVSDMDALLHAAMQVSHLLDMGVADG
jgi:hypothetical protein